MKVFNVELKFNLLDLVNLGIKKFLLLYVTMKKLAFIFILSLSFMSLKAQKSSDVSLQYEKPKLVVGIVVDQMRADYLSRFWNKFGDEGFRRMIEEGYNFKNNHFNYIPTYTAPGHASVYTGTTPQNHGIIGNGWYDKFDDEFVYCVGDESVKSIGTTSNAGKMSPHRMITTTVADENRLFTQMHGKTIGIAIKDRGAILPAGHTANAAYWFHGENEGKFISSSFYMEELPAWVQKFNNSGKVGSYFKDWETLQPISTYSESGDDKNLFEGGYQGKADATFPYDLNELRSENNNFDLLKATPFGNSFTTDFAIAALDGEELGKDDITDFLAISFSSTDYIGHNFGVNSKEVQDAYLRLDVDIARLLKALDEKVGKGNYTVFLTSDHGGVDVPAYLQSVNIPAGYFENDVFEKDIKKFLNKEFEIEGIIENISNNQIFFDYEVLRLEDIDFRDLENTLAHYLLQYPQIFQVFTRTQLQSGSFANGIANLIQNGFNQKRSGDIFISPDPSVISYSKTGSTHGSGFYYDTQAPLIFFGNGVPHGSTFQRSEIVDIAPTIAAMLGISNPNAATGEPLYIMLDQKE